MRILILLYIFINLKCKRKEINKLPSPKIEKVYILKEKKSLDSGIPKNVKIKGDHVYHGFNDEGNDIKEKIIKKNKEEPKKLEENLSKQISRKRKNIQEIPKINSSIFETKYILSNLVFIDKNVDNIKIYKDFLSLLGIQINKKKTDFKIKISNIQYLVKGLLGDGKKNYILLLKKFDKNKIEGEAILKVSKKSSKSSTEARLELEKEFELHKVLYNNKNIQKYTVQCQKIKFKVPSKSKKDYLLLIKERVKGDTLSNLQDEIYENCRKLEIDKINRNIDEIQYRNSIDKYDQILFIYINKWINMLIDLSFENLVINDLHFKNIMYQDEEMKIIDGNLLPPSYIFLDNLEENLTLAKDKLSLSSSVISQKLQNLIKSKTNISLNFGMGKVKKQISRKIKDLFFKSNIAKENNIGMWRMKKKNSYIEVSRYLLLHLLKEEIKNLRKSNKYIDEIHIREYMKNKSKVLYEQILPIVRNYKKDKMTK